MVEKVEKGYPSTSENQRYMRACTADRSKPGGKPKSEDSACHEIRVEQEIPL
jgi:hypothetical protein